MFATLINVILNRLLAFTLHVSGNGSFPKPLSAKAEAECLQLVALGDEEARSKLILHNLRLVAHIIKKYYSTQKDQDDLISIGTIGLIKAISSFQYDRGTRFATYAARCIENEILMYFRNIKKSSQDVYISDPIDTDKDGNALSLMDIIAEEDTIIDQIDLRIKTEQLYRHMICVLSERENTILTLRYGLGCSPPLTQREVADRLGISRSYVSRIEKKALEKLRVEFDKTN